MPLFECSACKAKDDHILSLRHQVQALEKLVLPSRPTQDITLAEAEVDEMYNGPSIIPPFEETDNEANNLLSGNFGTIPEEF
jgi:hypothetical protein